jgi:GNAT superfamily N-acetyltransferase
MMNQISISNLQHVPIEVITDAFNQAFSDYLVPVQLTEAQMQLKMQQEHIDLQWSVGAFDDGRLVGLILHGFRVLQSGTCLYNAGTGVWPPYRGRQLTERMYAWLKPQAIAAGIDRIILEAITANERAIHVYERIGFRQTRVFNLWQGASPEIVTDSGVVLTNYSSIDWNQVQPWFSTKPCWSAASMSIDSITGSVLTVGAEINDEMVGYLCVLRHNGRLLQMAVHPNFRNKGIGKAMLYEAFRQLQLPSFLALNIVAQDQPTNHFFEKLGWRLALQQYEMALTLQQAIEAA